MTGKSSPSSALNPAGEGLKLVMSEATLGGGGVGVCMSFDASWSECTVTRAGRGRGRPEGGRRRGAELKAPSKDRLLAVRSAAETDLGNGRCQHDGRTTLTSQGEGGAVGQEGATGGRRLRRCARLYSLRPTRIGTFAWPENAGGKASSLRPPGRLVVDHLLASGLSAALSAWQSDHDTARSFCLIHSYASDAFVRSVRRRRPRRPGALSLPERKPSGVSDAI
jgi:hypothetical protein